MRILKRVNWPLDNVLEVFKGADGVGRVAKIKVAESELIRPIIKLYPLEISSDEPECLKNSLTVRLV